MPGTSTRTVYVTPTGRHRPAPTIAGADIYSFERAASERLGEDWRMKLNQIVDQQGIAAAEHFRRKLTWAVIGRCSAFAGVVWPDAEVEEHAALSLDISGALFCELPTLLVTVDPGPPAETGGIRASHPGRPHVPTGQLAGDCLTRLAAHWPGVTCIACDADAVARTIEDWACRNT